MDPQNTDSLGFDEDENRNQRLCNAIRMLHFTFSLGMFEELKFNKKNRDVIGGTEPADFDRNKFFCLVLPRNKKIVLDLSLQILFPKHDDKNLSVSWTVFDVSPTLNDSSVYDQVKRKVNALHFLVKGPNSFDQFLFFLRRVTATPQQRHRLLNGQLNDFVMNYIIPYGPGWGRYYYMMRTARECKRYIKSLAIVGGVIFTIFVIRKLRSFFF